MPRSAPATPSTDAPDAPRTPLGRAEWITAAIDTLAEQGIDGLRIEALARRCGVTKGSFYWHFRDRRELAEAVLAEWQTGRLADLEHHASAGPGEAQALLQDIVDRYATRRNQRGIAIELAIRDWARRDAQAAAVVEAVDHARLEGARQLLLSCGVPENEAKARSLLLYAYIFGQTLMLCDGYDADIGALRRQIAQKLIEA